VIVNVGAMTADIDSDSCEAVDVLVSVRVPDPGAAAAGEDDGLVGVRGLDVSGFFVDEGHGFYECTDYTVINAPQVVANPSSGWIFTSWMVWLLPGTRVNFVPGPYTTA